MGNKPYNARKFHKLPQDLGPQSMPPSRKISNNQEIKMKDSVIFKYTTTRYNSELSYIREKFNFLLNKIIVNV